MAVLELSAVTHATSSSLVDLGWRFIIRRQTLSSYLPALDCTMRRLLERNKKRFWKIIFLCSDITKENLKL